MRPQELNIGDWVICSDPTPFKITGIYNKDPYVVTDEDGLEVEVGDLKPIPLTDEILKDNGWITDVYSTLSLEDGKWLEYYHFENRFGLWYKGVDEWQNHAEIKEIIMQCHCTYVHELQHALRLCGLTEMADNFRITQ